VNCAYCRTTVHDAQCGWCGAPTGLPKASRFDTVVRLASDGILSASAARRLLGFDESTVMTGCTTSICVLDSTIGGIIDYAGDSNS
jgi:hypothetical protein